MFSKYFNPSARKNIISLDPTSDKSWFYVMILLCIIGIIGVFMTTAYIRNDVRKSAKVYYYPADYCMICHGPRNAEPAIKNYRDYKKAHPALSQKRLLDDLRVSQ